jgi:hypothetical protein
MSVKCDGNHAEPRCSDLACWHGFTNEQYHALDSVSHSRLELFRSSKRSYKAVYVEKTLTREQTEAMLLGSIVHAITIEPLEVNRLYTVAPNVDRRTKSGKETWSEFIASCPGKTVVEADMMRKALDIANAIKANSVFRDLFDSSCHVERPVFWKCPVTGLDCRAKPDIHKLPSNIVVDLKTCTSASPGGFASSAARYGYGRQAAWYQWGCEIAYPEYGKPNFIFIAVSTKEPYEVGIYELSEWDLNRSRMQNEIDLAELAECMRTGNWEARHESNVMTLSMPKWAEFEDQYQAY